MVLSASNPLDGLSALRAPLGVMAGGRCYDQARLRGLLRDVAKRYAEAAFAD